MMYTLVTWWFPTSCIPRTFGLYGRVGFVIVRDGSVGGAAVERTTRERGEGNDEVREKVHFHFITSVRTQLSVIVKTGTHSSLDLLGKEAALR